MRFTTEPVRLNFPHLDAPHTNFPNAPEKFSAMFLIPKSDKKTLALFKKAKEAAIEEGLNGVFNGNLPKGSKFFYGLKDADNPATDEDAETVEKYPELSGHFYVTATNLTRPPLVHKNLEPVSPGDARAVFYSGCWVRAALVCRPYLAKGGKGGVTFFLDAVQFARDGEPLGSTFRVSEVFDAIDDDDDDDDNGVL